MGGFALADDVPSLPEMTISAEREEDSKFEPIPMKFGFGPQYTSEMDMYQDLALHAFWNRLRREASVCDMGVHEDFRSVTGGSDVFTRWMAAQHVFSLLIAKQTFRYHLGLMRDAKVVINGMQYAIIVVTYADSASETWAVRPNYILSTDKLVDEPAAGSLRYPPTGPTSGCSGIG